ncbi:class I SAM-dependent methyltransferase [Mycobacterium sp. NPDC003323]
MTVATNYLSGCTDSEAATLVREWDGQQEVYIADRERRFAVMIEVLTLACPTAPLVVDLGCGPGSLSGRILDALPDARVLAVDFDPLLLELAARTVKPAHPGRITLLDTDLEGPSWPADVRAALRGCTPAAFVSTTALHWLHPGTLTKVYAEAAALLDDGGILLNGDHFRFGPRMPALRRIAAAHEESVSQAALSAGAFDWAQWWDRLRSQPWAADLAVERDNRFATRPSTPDPAIDFHLAALTLAGFGEVSAVYQLFDDYVVFGGK